MNKSEVTWLYIKEWLKNNPGKKAAIVTPDATYKIEVTSNVGYITKEIILEFVDE